MARRVFRRPWLALFGVLAACAHGDALRPFPEGPPVWRDEGDFRAYAPAPEEYVSPFAWDGADNMLFRPLARMFAVDPGREAIDVNQMDEVPDSSWFTNRLGHTPLSVDEVVRAACDEAPLHPAGPWTITAGKPNGANPGFIIKDDGGRHFLLKFDSIHGERATAADIIGSILYWAHGFHVPCNRLVWFDRSIIRIAPGTTAEIDGHDVPMTWEMLEPVFRNAIRDGEGRFRAASSRFLDGSPIGPWRYEGVRDDDPNDVVPHEHRRELRGSYVLAAWVNHFDAREQNTLATFVERDDGLGYVRHHLIDFGDAFGSQWGIDGISRRLGHASYFDLRFFFADLVTLGLIPRPWDETEIGAAGPIFGYYDATPFDPDAYRPGYPNPAFQQATERDKAWMARILARFTPEMVRAAVREGEMQSAHVERELVRILLARREALLRRFLGRVSPLTDPVVVARADGPRVCVQDLLVTTGFAAPGTRPYWARGFRRRGARFDRVAIDVVSRQVPDRVCIALPELSSGDYLVVDVGGRHGTDSGEGPLRIHLRGSAPVHGEPSNRLEPRGSDAHRRASARAVPTVVGLERPYTSASPVR